MPEDELPNFSYRGARACILLHEQILRQFVENLKQAKGSRGIPAGKQNQ